MLQKSINKFHYSRQVAEFVTTLGTFWCVNWNNNYTCFPQEPSNMLIFATFDIWLLKWISFQWDWNVMDVNWWPSLLWLDQKCDIYCKLVLLHDFNVKPYYSAVQQAGHVKKSITNLCYWLSYWYLCTLTVFMQHLFQRESRLSVVDMY